MMRRLEQLETLLDLSEAGVTGPTPAAAGTAGGAAPELMIRQPTAETVVAGAGLAEVSFHEVFRCNTTLACLC